MPIYQYKCIECDLKIEEIKKMDEKDDIDYTLCPNKDLNYECQLKRIVSGVSDPQFKGSGFYSTDYK